MKIYTGSGDRGKTSLFSGERVLKSNERIEAYGDVDELNSFLGLLAAHLPREHAGMLSEIHRIQSDLFHIGAWLATSPDSASTRMLNEISDDSVGFLESAIDRMENELIPLQNFILPGGHPTSALAHVGRTICRRAERHVVQLTGTETGRQMPDSLNNLIIYLNRLSDYLFVLARYCNFIAGIEDVAWTK
jgi:cob(I)alamin adenosyltransferase